MGIQQIKSLAQYVIEHCENANPADLERIYSEIILKVLNDAIAIASGTRLDVPQPLCKAVFNSLSKLSSLVTASPTTTASSAAPPPPATASSAAAPPATVSSAAAPPTTSSSAAAPPTTSSSAAAPPATVSSAAAPPTTVSSTTSSPTTVSSTAPPPATTLDEEILKNLKTWETTPEEFFKQDSISTDNLCSYIQSLERCKTRNNASLRFAKASLYQSKLHWSHKSKEAFLHHLTHCGVNLSETHYDAWMRDGKIFTKIAKKISKGTYLSLELTPTQLKRFPLKDENKQRGFLNDLIKRGAEKEASQCERAADKIMEHLNKRLFPNGKSAIFINATSSQATRKRRPSQELGHRGPRAFHTDKTPVGFDPRTESTSSPKITEIRNATETGTAGTDKSTTRDFGRCEECRTDVENLQQPSPTPTLFATPRRDSNSGTNFAENGDQGPLDWRTDKPADNHHQAGCIHMRQSLPAQTHATQQTHRHSRHLGSSPRQGQQFDTARIECINTTRGNSYPICASDVASPSRSIGHELSHNPRETSYHPQAPGGISSSSLATHSAPSSTAIEILPTQTPSFDSRSNSPGHIPTQSPSSAQSRHPEPSHGFAETHHQQHNYPPPQPPTPDKVSDATSTQSHAIGTPSLGPQSESHQSTVQKHLDSTRSFPPSSSEHALRECATPCEAFGRQHSFQERQTSIPYAASPMPLQPYQSLDSDDAGCLGQPMDQASDMSYPSFEVFQDNDPSATGVDWDSLGWRDFGDVSTSILLFPESGEALPL